MRASLLTNSQCFTKRCADTRTKSEFSLPPINLLFGMSSPKRLVTAKRPATRTACSISLGQASKLLRPFSTEPREVSSPTLEKSQSSLLRREVAQVSNLLYRRFPIGKASPVPLLWRRRSVCGLETVGDLRYSRFGNLRLPSVVIRLSRYAARRINLTHVSLRPDIKWIAGHSSGRQDAALYGSQDGRRYRPRPEDKNGADKSPRRSVPPGPLGSKLKHRNRGRIRKGAGAGESRRLPCAWPPATSPGSLR